MQTSQRLGFLSRFAVLLALLLLLGLFGTTPPSAPLIDSTTKDGGWDDAFDDLTAAQRGALEETAATAGVGGRTVGRADHEQLGWEWAERAGGSSFEYGRGIAVDSSGNAYVTGYFEGSSANFGSTTLSNSDPTHSDVFVAKLDSSGNWLWAKRTGSSADSDHGHGIAVDSSGNVYLTGDFQESSTIGTAGGSTTLSSSGGYDVFVVKLDSNGNWLWAKRAGGSGDDQGYGIAVDLSGNAYVTGTFTGSPADFGNTTLSSVNSMSGPGGSPDVFVAKLDSSGNWLWAERAGGPSADTGFGIAVDSSDNTYVTGIFTASLHTNPADFGNTTLLSSSGSSDVFVAKLDSSGDWLWAKRAGGSTDSNVGIGIAVDSSFNAYVTGYFTGSSADFGNTTLNSSGSSDVFVAKLDSSGDWLWAKRAGGAAVDDGSGIAVDSSGNAYLTGGFFGSSADFGNTTLSKSNSSRSDVFVAKLDSSGDWLWAKRAGGSVNDLGYGIAVDSSGNAYVIGYFQGLLADFGSTTLNSSWDVHQDVFVAKMSKDSDGDGVPDSSDQCEGFDDSIDVDGDGIPDGCDPFVDSDGDGVPDSTDQCEGFDDSIDVDGDGIPDGCDPLIDSDGDGVPDSSDQCEGFDDSIDVDGDGIPDGCDPFVDSDGDGVVDSADACPNSEVGERVDANGCSIEVVSEPDIGGDGTFETSDDGGWFDWLEWPDLDWPSFGGGDGGGDGGATPDEPVDIDIPLIRDIDILDAFADFLANLGVGGVPLVPPIVLLAILLAIRPVRERIFAAVLWLWEFTKTVCGKVKKAIDALDEKLKALWKGLVEALGPIGRAIEAPFVLFGRLIKAIWAFWTGILDVIGRLISGFFAVLLSPFGSKEDGTGQPWDVDHRSVDLRLMDGTKHRETFFDDEMFRAEIAHPEHPESMLLFEEE